MNRAALAAIATSVAWGCVVAVLGYAAIRAEQFFAAPPLDPRATAWSTHAGYFWRALIVGYAGGIASFVAFTAGGARLDASTRALPGAVLAAAFVLAVQALFLP